MFSMLFDFCIRAFAFVSGFCFVIGGLVCTYWAISSPKEFFVDPGYFSSRLGGFLFGLSVGIVSICLGFGFIEIAFGP